MFSKATEYALRATIYIAKRSADKNKPGLAEIARAIDSPKSFTAKKLQLLTKENKVVSFGLFRLGGQIIASAAPRVYHSPGVSCLESARSAFPV